MSSIIAAANVCRDEQILLNYNAALAEFENKIKSSPLETIFYIYSGCISDDMTKAILQRLVAEGVKATAAKTFFGYNYIRIDNPFNQKPTESELIDDDTVIIPV